MTLLTLRALLAFMQLFQGSEIPIKELKEWGIIEKLHSILDLEHELLGELVRLSIGILTQVSYTSPNEISKFNIKKIVSLCDGTNCQDLKT